MKFNFAVVKSGLPETIVCRHIYRDTAKNKADKLNRKDTVTIKDLHRVKYGVATLDDKGEIAWTVYTTP